MSLLGLEPSLLNLTRAAALRDDQARLLQLILRGLGADNPVTHEAALRNSVQAAVGRASVVVHSRATTGTQPFPSLVKDVCLGAQMAVATAQRSRGSRAVLSSVHNVLATVIGSANATLTANCVSTATALSYEESRLAQMIRADLVAFWDRSRVRIPDVRFLAREIAVMLLSHNRHVSGVRLSMERALRRTAGSGAELAALLFPDPQRFRVACTVDGTNRLEHLRELTGVLPLDHGSPARRPAGIRTRTSPNADASVASRDASEVHRDHAR